MTKNQFPSIYLRDSISPSPDQLKAFEKLKSANPRVELVSVDPIGGAPTLRARVGIGSPVVGTLEPREAIAKIVEDNPELFMHSAEQVRESAIRKDVEVGGRRTVTLEQMWQGLPVYSATIQASFDSAGRMVGLKDRFLATRPSPDGIVSLPAASRDGIAEIAAGQALTVAGASVGESDVQLPSSGYGPARIDPKRLETRVRLAWMPDEHNGVQLVWDTAFESIADTQVYRTLVGAKNGDVLLRMEMGCSAAPPVAPALAEFRVWADSLGQGMSDVDRGLRGSTALNPDNLLSNTDNPFPEYSRVRPTDPSTTSTAGRGLVSNRDAAAAQGFFEYDWTAPYPTEYTKFYVGSPSGWLATPTNNGNGTVTYRLDAAGNRVRAFASGGSGNELPTAASSPSVTVTPGTMASFDAPLGSAEATTIQSFYTTNWIWDRFAITPIGSGAAAYPVMRSYLDLSRYYQSAYSHMLVDARKSNLSNNARYLPQIAFGADDLHKSSRLLSNSVVGVVNGGNPIFSGGRRAYTEQSVPIGDPASAGKIVAGVFNTSNGTRDAGLDAGVMAHEWGHALSSAMIWNGNGPPQFVRQLIPEANGTTLSTSGLSTGFATPDAIKVANNARACLDASMALSEGLSDFLALLAITPDGKLSSGGPSGRHGAFPIGAYAKGNTTGLRKFPYSSDKSINPITVQNHGSSSVLLYQMAYSTRHYFDPPPQSGPLYMDLPHVLDGKFLEPHAFGAIWASILWDLRVYLIDEFNALYPSDPERAYRLATQVMWESVESFMLAQGDFNGYAISNWMEEFARGFKDSYYSMRGGQMLVDSNQTSSVPLSPFRSIGAENEWPNRPAISDFEMGAATRALNRALAARGLGAGPVLEMGIYNTMPSVRSGSYVSEYTTYGSRIHPFRVLCETKIKGKLSASIGGYPCSIEQYPDGHRTALLIKPHVNSFGGIQTLEIRNFGNSNAAFGNWDWSTELSVFVVPTVEQVVFGDVGQFTATGANLLPEGYNQYSDLYVGYPTSATEVETFAYPFTVESGSSPSRLFGQTSYSPPAGRLFEMSIYGAIFSTGKYDATDIRFSPDTDPAFGNRTNPSAGSTPAEQFALASNTSERQKSDGDHAFWDLLHNAAPRSQQIAAQVAPSNGAYVMGVAPQHIKRATTTTIRLYGVGLSEVDSIAVSGFTTRRTRIQGNNVEGLVEFTLAPTATAAFGPRTITLYPSATSNTPISVGGSTPLTINISDSATLASTPAATTGIYGPQGGSATITTSVNCRGRSTQLVLEYGLDSDSLNQELYVTIPDDDATAAQSVSALLQELPFGKYYYRFKARNDWNVDTAGAPAWVYHPLATAAPGVLTLGFGSVVANFSSADEPGLTAAAVTLTASSALTVNLATRIKLGQSVTVINNTGTAAISGVFSNLPDGGYITSQFGGDTYRFKADYTAGDGNDLVLTRVARDGQQLLYQWTNFAGRPGGVGNEDGPLVRNALKAGRPIAIHPSGDIYFTQEDSSGSLVLRKLDTSGNLLVVPGNGGWDRRYLGYTANTPGSELNGMAITPDGRSCYLAANSQSTAGFSRLDLWYPEWQITPYNQAPRQNYGLALGADGSTCYYAEANPATTYGALYKATLTLSGDPFLPGRISVPVSGISGICRAGNYIFAVVKKSGTTGNYLTITRFSVTDLSSIEWSNVQIPGGDFGNIAVDSLDNWVVTNGTNLVSVGQGNSAGVTIGGANGGYQDGDSVTAMFKAPTGVAAHPNGNIYMIDQEGTTIRRLSFAGGAASVATVAGAPSSPGLVDGVGIGARLWAPSTVQWDASRERIIVGGTSMSGPTGGVSSPVITDVSRNAEVVTRSIYGTKYGTAEVTTPASLQVTDIAVSAAGETYYLDRTCVYKLENLLIDSEYKVVQVVVAGHPSTAGNTNAVGISARFTNAYSMAYDRKTDALFIVQGNNLIRRLILSSTSVATVAGVVNSTTSVDGNGTAAKFASATAIRGDGNGTLFVTDAGKIRKLVIGTSVNVQTPTLPAGFTAGPIKAVTLDGALLLSSNVYHPWGGGQVTRLNLGTSPSFSILGGSGRSGWGDGLGSQASFGYGISSVFPPPMGVTVTPDGNLYVADPKYHRLSEGIPGAHPIFSGLAIQPSWGSGHFDFSVNPNGMNTQVLLEVGLNASTYTIALPLTLASPDAMTPQLVQTTVTSLLPNSNYFYRITTSNSDGTIVNSGMFTTQNLVVPGIASIAVTRGAISYPQMNVAVSVVKLPSSHTTETELQRSLDGATWESVGGRHGGTTFGDEVSIGANLVQTFHYRARLVLTLGSSDYYSDWSSVSTVTSPLFHSRLTVSGVESSPLPGERVPVAVRLEKVFDAVTLPVNGASISIYGSGDVVLVNGSPSLALVTNAQGELIFDYIGGAGNATLMIAVGSGPGAPYLDQNGSPIDVSFNLELPSHEFEIVDRFPEPSQNIVSLRIGHSLAVGGRLIARNTTTQRTAPVTGATLEVSVTEGTGGSSSSSGVVTDSSGMFSVTYSQSSATLGGDPTDLTCTYQPAGGLFAPPAVTWGARFYPIMTMLSPVLPVAELTSMEPDAQQLIRVRLTEVDAQTGQVTNLGGKSIQVSKQGDGAISVTSGITASTGEFALNYWHGQGFSTVTLSAVGAGLVGPHTTVTRQFHRPLGYRIDTLGASSNSYQSNEEVLLRVRLVNQESPGVDQPVANTLLNVTLQGGSGSVPNNSVFTDSNGEAEMLYTQGSALTAVTFTATGLAGPQGAPVKATYRMYESGASESYYLAQQLPEGDIALPSEATEQLVVTLYRYDPNSLDPAEPMPGVQLTYDMLVGDGSISMPTVDTGSNSPSLGTAVNTFTMGAALSTVRVRALGLPGSGGEPPTALFNFHPLSNHTMLLVAPQSGTAVQPIGEESVVEIRVVAWNSLTGQSVPLANKPVDVVLAGNGSFVVTGTGSGSSEAQVTRADGTFEVTYTQGEGPATLTLTSPTVLDDTSVPLSRSVAMLDNAVTYYEWRDATPSPMIVPANGQGVIQMQLYQVDESLGLANPVNAVVPVTVTVTGDGDVGLMGTSTTTDANGQLSLNYTHGSGAVTIQVAADSTEYPDSVGGGAAISFSITEPVYYYFTPDQRQITNPDPGQTITLSADLVFRPASQSQPLPATHLEGTEIWVNGSPAGVFLDSQGTFNLQWSGGLGTVRVEIPGYVNEDGTTMTFVEWTID